MVASCSASRSHGHNRTGVIEPGPLKSGPLSKTYDLNYGPFSLPDCAERSSNGATAGTGEEAVSLSR
jgi:hypothetical protein